MKSTPAPVPEEEEEEEEGEGRIAADERNVGQKKGGGGKFEEKCGTIQYSYCRKVAPPAAADISHIDDMCRAQGWGRPRVIY